MPRSTRSSSAGPAAALFVVLAIAGCTTQGTTSGQAASTHRAVPAKAQSASAKPTAATPITGTRLSSLLTAPDGFAVEQSRSSDSGDVPISGPPGTSLRRVSCANWWAGRSYYGPGDVGYAVKDFTSHDGITVTVTVILFRRGGGTGVFDASVALQHRCTHFRYQDASDHLWYQVDVKPASSAGLGDRSQTYDATETAQGDVFPTEVTLIQIGDATIGINQTGPAGSPPKRVVPALTRLIVALRAAGY